MTEPDEPVRRRKPLRRTAWSLLIGGLVMTGLMVGVGLLLLAGGEDIGPGRPGVWPAGERASVHKHPGPKDTQVPRCEALGTDDEREYRWLEWADSVRSPIEFTVTCKQGAIFLTGTASAIVSAFQSELIMAPIVAAMLGILLFFPRFIMGWVLLARPRSRLVDKWIDRRR